MLRDKNGLSPTNQFVCALILASLLMTILRTEVTVYAGREHLFLIADLMLTGLLAVEYGLRLWVCTENPAYRSRLAYALTPATLIDLLAVLLILFSPLGNQGFLLRLARLARILRLAKLGRFSLAFNAVTQAVGRRAYELWLSLVFSAALLLVSSAFLYLIEGGIQPEAFGSIPRAMWWSVATLTTVGYGDVYPVTAVGRFFGALTAIIGIGLIAMPTGILASAFSEAFQERCLRNSAGADEPMNPPAE
ncbi:ion transporter [Thiorhodococcus mannitoliphagus]|uniref:Ion transporter n=2 Tax=Thiorhodococcus mannitoliphagus TaxID=329406 RepID=A0A6P1DV87_9GAMM|nr:ion transporter [Thiorhodococcus mannitoliphagus]